MIVFVAIQMSAPKRKSPQSVIVELRIEGINVFELSFTFIYSKENVYELTECQNDIKFWFRLLYFFCFHNSPIHLP